MAQPTDPSVLDGIYVKEHVPARKPVPYHHIREADMMWTKMIWRMLDLKEKINHPLYFPINSIRIENSRYSLITLLLESIDAGDLEVYDDDEFTQPLTIATIDEKFDAVESTTFVEDEQGNMIEQKVKGSRNYGEVSKLLMKEVWYFDKQRAKLEVRIVALCPVRMAPPKKVIGEEESVSDAGDEPELTMKKMFWVYFLAARPILANHEVFNANNDAERRTYDDIFFKRRFSSYIFNETNVYENRVISEFKKGLDALLESERIKDWMFKIEHDLWEF